MAKTVNTLVTKMELDTSSYKRSAAEIKRINDSLKMGGNSFGGSLSSGAGGYKGAISGVAGAAGAAGGNFAGIGAASLGVQRAQLTRLNAVHAGISANHRVLQQILVAIKSSGSGSSAGSGISSGVIPRNRIGVIGRKKGGVASAVTHAVTDIDDMIMQSGAFNIVGGKPHPHGAGSASARFTGPAMYASARKGSKQSGGIPIGILNDAFKGIGNVFTKGGHLIHNAIARFLNVFLGKGKLSLLGAPPVGGGSSGGGIGGMLKGLASGDMAGLAGGAAVGAAGTAITGFVAGIAAGSAAMASLSKAAFESFLDFDKMEASIGGALGSLTRGKEVMKELQNYAKSSSFSLKDLAASSVTLSAGGMNLAKSLPLAEKFAQAIGGTSGDLEQVSSALLKVQGGSFGEAMEIFRKAGVSTSALRGAGVNITAGGEVKSSSADFMAALEKLSGPGTAVGGLADAVKGSSATKISNAGDALEQVLTTLGTGIKDSIIPLIDSFTTALSNLVESGTIDMVAESFTRVISAISDNVDFGVIFDTLANSFIIFADFMSTAIIPAVELVYNAIKGVVGGLYKVIEWVATIPVVGAGAKAFLDVKKFYVDDRISQADSGKVSKEYLDMKKKRDAKKKKNVLDTSDSPNAQDGAEAKSKEKENKAKSAQDIIAATQNAYLARIANATEKALDIQAMILGGGRLAAQGISPNDLTNQRHQGRNAIRTDPGLAQLGMFVQTAIQNGR